MKILIVDDYMTMRKILRNLLIQLGYQNIDEAKEGNEAFKMIESNNYDLIISDWNMEPVSGYQLLLRIRQHSLPDIANLPFIMVTAESKTENVIAAKKAGVSNYIIKPFTADTLRDKIKTVLGK